jgi:predicted aspartyl protease
MSFQFEPEKGLIIVPTRILGPNGDTIVHLALDTGATSSLINWDVAMIIGYDPAIVKERIHMTTGSSVEFAPSITVRKIEALGVIKEHFRIVCHTLPPSAKVDGLLGLDFFRDTRLIIDFISGKIEVHLSRDLSS